MKAIETTYGGFRFRSRTEARWAVFFDALGIKWDYEKDGYDLGDGKLYLPDFWLPESQAYVEVKGQEFTVAEVNLCRILAQKSSYPVVMLPGVPEAKEYQAEMPNGLLGSHFFTTDRSLMAEAVVRARTSRFEHGETPSQERISHRTRREDDSPETAHARELDARAAEIDRLIPLAEGAEKENLITEKEAIRMELKATGRNYYKTFRRSRYS